MNEVSEYDRVPPQAVEVEEGVLGAMLIEGEALEMALDRLTVREFYKAAHKHIFEALKTLHEAGSDCDMLSVEQFLRDKELLEKCGGAYYLSELTRSVSSAANIDYHAQILSEKATLRQVILEGLGIVKEAYSPDADPYDILDAWKQKLEEIEDKSFLEVPASSSQALSKVLTDTLEERNIKDGLVGVPSYLPIDRLTAGFPSKEVCYIAARPSMGKTGYMLTIIMNLILNGFNQPILIFSYEMDRDILLLRLMCMIAKVNMQLARRGKLNDQEKKKLTDAAKKMGVDATWNHQKQRLEIHSIEDSILFIEDDNMTDVGRMEAKARRIKKDHGLGMVCVDYLQLVPVWNTKQLNIGTREQEVAYISRSMKNQAKTFNVPYVVLSQLSRAVENRKGDNRPQLSDLRESGSIEQDATMVMFLYRPMYYNIKRTDEGISTKGLCEVILGKNRNGPTGTEKHEFIKEYALFDKWDEQKAALREGSGPPQQQQPWMQGKDDPGDYPNEIEDEYPF